MNAVEGMNKDGKTEIPAIVINCSAGDTKYLVEIDQGKQLLIEFIENSIVFRNVGAIDKYNLEKCLENATKLNLNDANNIITNHYNKANSIRFISGPPCEKIDFTCLKNLKRLSFSNAPVATMECTDMLTILNKIIKKNDLKYISLSCIGHEFMKRINLNTLKNLKKITLYVITKKHRDDSKLKSDPIYESPEDFLGAVSKNNQQLETISFCKCDIDLKKIVPQLKSLKNLKELHFPTRVSGEIPVDYILENVPNVVIHAADKKWFNPKEG